MRFDPEGDFEIFFEVFSKIDLTSNPKPASIKPTMKYGTAKPQNALTSTPAHRGLGSKNPNHYTPNIPLFQMPANVSNFVKSPLAVHYPKNKIRKRLSYQFWSNVTNSISMLPHKKRVSVIYNMWLQMDGRHAFGTYKQAGFELESAVLSLIDLREKQDGTK